MAQALNLVAGLILFGVQQVSAAQPITPSINSVVNDDNPWTVIKSADFAPAPRAPLIPQSQSVTAMPITPQVGLTPIEQAPPHLHPELAAQYLESARWNRGRENYEAMLSNLQAAANYANPGAHYELARLYIEGKYVTKDHNKSSVHLHAAAALGYAEAQRALGRMLLRGDLGEKDEDKGLALLTQAAQSSVRAQRELGMWYAGLLDGLVRDRGYGIALLEAASSVGDEQADAQLAILAARDDTALPESPLPVMPDSVVTEHAGSAYQVERITPDSPDYRAPQPAQQQAWLTSEQMFAKANAIMLQPQSKRSLEDEALAYAIFQLAFERGNDAAGRELNYLDGVRVLMDRKYQDWQTEWRSRAEQAVVK